MRELNPEHNKTVKMENVMKVLYLRLLKALYGCIYSTLLCYDLYSKTLKSYGFIFNPYDRCIANITISGKQFMIYCYVDDDIVLQFDKHMNRMII